ncbi:hypothetical protein BofuT4_uP023830.1 [Botrytis cinerea T4]|uniref:Uncharacterized protein n=1 Tax=Botryotinia fuckeliana (strain T4) TaxID=999810 RepID=G2YFM6_BOTF4|nr:hypothetical protein BofuT4_uP023830.1 [Botrytis cinerea T4]
MKFSLLIGLSPLIKRSAQVSLSVALVFQPFARPIGALDL